MVRLKIISRNNFFGSRVSEVQILSPRPVNTGVSGFPETLFLFIFLSGYKMGYKIGPAIHMLVHPCLSGRLQQPYVGGEGPSSGYTYDTRSQLEKLGRVITGPLPASTIRVS